MLEAGSDSGLSEMSRVFSHSLEALHGVNSL